MCDCNCSNFAIIELADLWGHHHIRCPKYETEKHPYLFYYCGGCDAWVPTSERIVDVIDVGDFDADEEREIKFKRVDMTDKEFADMPDE